MADDPYKQGWFHQAASSQTSSPSFATPQVPAIPPPFNALSQNAYEQNASRIPGLGLGNGSAMSSSFLGMNWPNTQPQALQTSSHRQNQHGQPAEKRASQKMSAQQASSATPEEGELSEGEFADLYEPNHTTSAPPTALRNDSFATADGSSIYDPRAPQDANNLISTGSLNTSLPSAVQGNSTPDDEWEPPDQDREKSGSYSPYLSPREVHRKLSGVKNNITESKGLSSPGVPVSLPGHSLDVIRPKGAHSGSLQNDKKSVTQTSPTEGSNNTSLPYKPPEEKKQALQAILGLWSHKVRYQDYIEEGFDPNIVKALFAELGLDTSVSKSTLPSLKATMASGISSLPAKPLVSAVPGPQDKVPPSLPNHQQRSDDKSDKVDSNKAAKSAAEERKDKIARKLAAMAQKSTSTQGASSTKPTMESPPVQNPASATLSAPVVSSEAAQDTPKTVSPQGAKPDAINTPPVALKTRAENNALLQQKLAALKKQQAQLAAGKADDKPVTTLDGQSVPQPASASKPLPAMLSKDCADLASVSSGGPEVKPPDNSLSNVSPAKSHQSSDQGSSSMEPQSSAQGSSIPGLNSSILSQTRQSSGRGAKRPVAADFDTYTSSFETLKRSRTDDTLIIDVSDDEDIEMDMGSPAEESANPLDSVEFPAKQTLGAFPPLSDTPNRRQLSSPPSGSVPTPPIRGIKLDFLHKQIEETKRMIAEREAKKAAKQAILNSSSKPSTPVAQETVDSPKATAPRTETRKANSLRRERIVSYELPRIDATLKEKQDRLKLIVAQAAELELEVQAGLTEKQKLNAEAEELAESSRDSSPHPQHPPSNSTAEHAATADEVNGHTDKLSTPAPEVPGNPIIEGHDEESNSLPNNKGPTDDEALQTAIYMDNTDSPDSPDVPMADTGSPTNDDSLVPSGKVASGTSVGNSDQIRMGEVEEFSQETDDSTIIKEGLVLGSSELPAASAPITSQSSIPDIATLPSDEQMLSPDRELSRSGPQPYEPASVEDLIPEDTKLDDEQETLEDNDDVAEQTDEDDVSVALNSSQVQNASTEDLPRDTRPSGENALSYESPLTYFRAYRFHPRFSDTVAGGLKSMTFSAKIDPMKELCPQVLAGEECAKGAECEYQHFDTMTLSESEIITQLGSADMFVGETRGKFIEGLKRVLNQLKADRVKDFESITKAIIKHRQDFLDDKTKVLALDAGST